MHKPKKTKIISLNLLRNEVGQKANKEWRKLDIMTITHLARISDARLRVNWNGIRLRFTFCH